MTAVQFRLPDGEMLERAWYMGEEMPDLAHIPDWLDNPRRSWERPQDPVTFKGDVKPGREAEARAFVGVSHA